MIYICIRLHDFRVLIRKGAFNGYIKFIQVIRKLFDLRTGVHVVTAIEAPLLDLLGKYLDVPAAALMSDGIQRERVRFLSYLFYVGNRKKTDLPYEEESDAECDWYRLRHEKGGLGIEIDRDQLMKANKLYIENCLGARDDAKGMQYLIPGWPFDSKRPCMVR